MLKNNNSATQIIIYVRVSTMNQLEKGYSIPEQISICKKRAYELGGTDDTILTFADSETGEFLNREGFNEVIKTINKKKIDYFICYDPDRLSRSLTTALVAIDLIEKQDITIEFINSNYDKTPEGKLFFQIRAVIAEYEKEKIKIRSMMGKLGKAKRGLLTHSPGLYGYTYDPITDELIINENEAKIIRMMIKWIMEDNTKAVGYHTIVKRLNNMNILPPRGKKTDKKTTGKSYDKENGEWHKQTVKRILSNYSYTGTLYIHRYDTEGVKYNKYRKENEKIKRSERPKEEWYEVTVPPIIPEETWYELQKLLEERKNVKPGIAKENYWLSNQIRCGICGSTLHGNRVKKKGKENEYHKYYVCTAKSPGIKGKDKCSLPNINGIKLEKFLWENVKQWIIQPQILIDNILNDDSISYLNEEKKTIKTKLSKIELERQRINKAYFKEAISESEYDDYINEIKNQTNTLRKRLSQIENELTFKNTNVKEINDLINQIKFYKEKINDISDEEKKSLIKIFVHQIIVYDKNKIDVIGLIKQNEKLDNRHDHPQGSDNCTTFTIPISMI